uniref:Uncharacterized protein n=2 Tax=unclassified Caudoviricetes TaxID=2788787 RepID=A0A8S5QKS7_9CAUD|nr:MAG TPA: hypothetical protein [Siphoviridae sp. ctVii20]DAE19401.1 MAG TPA: hypothetical protein [Siphoviridae sp. ctezl47]
MLLNAIKMKKNIYTLGNIVDIPITIAILPLIVWENILLD